MRILTTALLSVYTLAAQTGTPPAFELATIKQSPPPTDGQMAVGGARNPGRVTLSNMTLRDLMARAYEVKLAQIAGPSWIDSERFDVNAKIPNGMTDQVKAMMRTLLEERFQMKLHRENKEMPVYELVQKGTLKLDKAAEPSSGARMTLEGTGDGVMHATINSATMANFSDMIGRWTDRPVLDKTGIAGQYDIKLDLALEDLQRSRTSVVGAVTVAGGPSNDNPAPEGRPTASLFTSVQKLGLKLEAKRAPLDLLVIDKAEKVPLEN
jgi:uncharacterized protein (TIGR03435 family)